MLNNQRIDFQQGFISIVWLQNVLQTHTISCIRYLSNMHFVRDFDRKLQLALLWDFFAVSFLCCETHRRSIDF
jgi:hypothetical protein